MRPWPVIVVAGLLAAVALTAAQSTEKPDPDPEAERLARFRCGICHAYPAPDLLPRSVWEQSVLPQMGHMMGIYAHDSIRLQLLEQGVGGERVDAANIFPKTPTIEREDWEKIRNFYLQNAPERLPEGDTLPIIRVLPQFNVEFPEVQLNPPSATMVKIRRNGGLFLGDANTRRLYWFDQNLKFQTSVALGEGVVALDERPDGLFVTVMGSFSPTDAPVGQAVRLFGNQGELLLDSLQRPVHTSWADLDADGLIDAVVCEYSKWTSALAWRKQLPEGGYKSFVLRNRPGAIKTFVRDLDGNGTQDIIALFGQGDEGIFAYYNDGKGNFTETLLLRFPPVYGSSTFRMADMNADGREDIVYTCGDNADYTPILKPYHGIRIFTNDGKNNFTETRFIPLNGAYDAIPADFDGDGDLDIAAVSFFPDFPRRPYEAFVYLQNDGKNQYTAYTFPQVSEGRWMVADAGDLDGDGDLDLILGPLTFEAVPDNGEVARWVKLGRPFVVLRNNRF